MSVSKQTLIRLPTIKAGLLIGKTRDEIGVECGVTERTIRRDIESWLDSGQFELWLKEEWIRLHNIIIHEEPVEAYRQLTKLISQTMTRKMEVKEEITEAVKVEIDLSVFSDDEKSILDKAAAILDRKSKGEPASIH